MNRLLFVVRSFSGSGAQPIRFRQIISYLVPEFDVHVLEFTHSRGGIRNKNGITIPLSIRESAKSLINKLQPAIIPPIV
jgi:hypothetical protein